MHEKRSRRSSAGAQAVARIAALCLCAIAGGCALTERWSTSTGSPDPRAALGGHDVVAVSRYRDASAGYRCLEGVLVCDGGGGSTTQQCSCSVTGVIRLQ